MVYNKEKWIAAYKKAVVDTKHEDRPTAGLPCAIATIRTFRDGLLDDLGPGGKDAQKLTVEEVIEIIKDSSLELIKLLGKDGVDCGFASNASAAAKAAGFKSKSVEVSELVD